MAESTRKLAAIVFTDIVGFTKLSSENEPAALALLETQRDLLKPVVDKYNGEWLKEIGDGLLLSFSTNRDVVDCSIAIQQATKEADGLNLRIGIHQGEVVFQGSDVVGDDVNIASRIESFAAEGGIAISGRVNASLERDPEFETMFIGTPKLKGVSQKTEVYCITSHNLPKTDISKVSGKKILYILFILLIVCSCNDNDEQIDKNCVENKQIDNWITESFKSNYSIQFPSNYEGQGMVGFEGNMYSKIRSDSLVELSYMYCSPLYCEDFGAILFEPIPSSIFTYNKQNTEVELTEQVLFCQNDDETALFYHNMEDKAVGKLYMKIDGLYLEAVSVFYDIDEHQEIENILKTIKSSPAQ